MDGKATQVREPVVPGPVEGSSNGLHTISYSQGPSKSSSGRATARRKAVGACASCTPGPRRAGWMHPGVYSSRASRRTTLTGPYQTPAIPNLTGHRPSPAHLLGLYCQIQALPSRSDGPEEAIGACTLRQPIARRRQSKRGHIATAMQPRLTATRETCVLDRSQVYSAYKGCASEC